MPPRVENRFTQGLTTVTCVAVSPMSRVAEAMTPFVRPARAADGAEFLDDLENLRKHPITFLDAIRRLLNTSWRNPERCFLRIHIPVLEDRAKSVLALGLIRNALYSH